MAILEKEVDQSLISKVVTSNKQESDRVAIVEIQSKLERSFRSFLSKSDTVIQSL